MKIATMKTGLGSLALLPGLAMAAPAVADKADNAFMMICTALVLFMTIPGIALFYGGLIRGKNVLSMLTQVIVTFGLVCVLWVVYGYTLAFGTGGSFFGSFDWVLLKNTESADGDLLSVHPRRFPGLLRLYHRWPDRGRAG